MKKSVMAVLTSMLAVMVASITLVFTVGPMVSAEGEVIVMNGAQYFNIDGNGVLNGLSDEGYHIMSTRGYSYVNKVYVTIPDGVTEIYNVFSRNGRWGEGTVVSVTLPNSLKVIGSDAFFNLHKLSSINIPAGVTEIGDSAFYYCVGLKSITLPNSVTAIGESAFADCSALSKVILSNHLISIGDGAFRNCKFSKILIPKSVKDFGQGFNQIFGMCSRLKEIIVEDEALLTNPRLLEYNGVTVRMATADDYEKVPEEKSKQTLVIAIAGGVGGAVGLGTIGTVIGVIVHKKRKHQ